MWHPKRSRHRTRSVLPIKSIDPRTPSYRLEWLSPTKIGAALPPILLRGLAEAIDDSGDRKLALYPDTGPESRGRRESHKWHTNGSNNLPTFSYLSAPARAGSNALACSVSSRDGTSSPRTPDSLCPSSRKFFVPSASTLFAWKVRRPEERLHRAIQAQSRLLTCRRVLPRKDC